MSGIFRLEEIRPKAVIRFDWIFSKQKKFHSEEEAFSRTEERSIIFLDDNKWCILIVKYLFKNVEYGIPKYLLPCK